MPGQLFFRHFQPECIDFLEIFQVHLNVFFCNMRAGKRVVGRERPGDQGQLEGVEDRKIRKFHSQLGELG